MKKRDILLITVSTLISSYYIYTIFQKRGEYTENKLPGKSDNEFNEKENPSNHGKDSIFDKISLRDFFVIIKNVRDNINQDEQRAELPKSMEDVTITPDMQAYLDQFPGIYEKFDYRLGLFDRVATCLGKDAPTSGHIKVGLYFELDRDQKIAIGSNNPPLTVYSPEFFDVDRTPLNKEEEEVVVNCLYQAHIGYTFDATSAMLYGSLKDYPPQQNSFEHPIAITFPMEEDDLYQFLAEGPTKFQQKFLQQNNQGSQ